MLPPFLESVRVHLTPQVDLAICVKIDGFCIFKNDDVSIKNDDVSIKNDDVSIKNDDVSI